MKSALAAFEAGVTDLRWYIEAIEIQWDLLAATSATPPCSSADGLASKLQRHVGKGVAKRRFDYNSIVISLYGLLEEYIESLIRAYVLSLNATVPRYHHLPEAIRNSHVESSFVMLNRSEQTRYRGTVTAESIVANLHSCLSDAEGYHVNADSFCFHTANFRQGAVDTIFGKVGIDNVAQRLRFFPPFVDYIASHFPDREASKITSDEMFFYLNDLADRRNDVAHGTPSDLLSNNLLLDYVAFAEAFCAALYELAKCHSLEHIIKHQAAELGDPIKVYNGSIVCLELRNTEIAVGDTLIATTGDAVRPYVSGEVQEIQVKNQPFVSVPAEPSVAVGLRVLFKAKQNYRYYLARRPAEEKPVVEEEHAEVEVSAEVEFEEDSDGEPGGFPKGQAE